MPPDINCDDAFMITKNYRSVNKCMGKKIGLLWAIVTLFGAIIGGMIITNAEITFTFVILVCGVIICLLQLLVLLPHQSQF